MSVVFSTTRASGTVILELVLHDRVLMMMPRCYLPYLRPAQGQRARAVPGVKLSLFAGAGPVDGSVRQPTVVKPPSSLHARRASCSRTFSFLLPACFFNISFRQTSLALAPFFLLVMTVPLAQVLMICNQAELAEGQVGMQPARPTHHHHHHHNMGAYLRTLDKVVFSKQKKDPS